MQLSATVRAVLAPIMFIVHCFASALWRVIAILIKTAAVVTVLALIAMLITGVARAQTCGFPACEAQAAIANASSGSSDIRYFCGGPGALTKIIDSSSNPRVCGPATGICGQGDSTPDRVCLYNQSLRPVTACVIGRSQHFGGCNCGARPDLKSPPKGFGSFGGQTEFCDNGCLFTGGPDREDVEFPGGNGPASYGTFKPSGEQCNSGPAPPEREEPPCSDYIEGGGKRICYDDSKPPKYCSTPTADNPEVLCVDAKPDPPGECDEGAKGALCIGPDGQPPPPPGPPNPSNPPPGGPSYPPPSTPPPSVTHCNAAGACITNNFNNHGPPAGGTPPGGGGDPPDPGGGGDPPDPGGGGDNPDPGGPGGCTNPAGCDPGGGGDDGEDPGDGGCTNPQGCGNPDPEEPEEPEENGNPGQGADLSSPIYSGTEKTIGSVFADFQASIGGSDLIQQLQAFLDIGNIGGDCPIWEIPATDYTDAWLIDMQCRDPLASLFYFAGYLILAMASLRAFHIAFDH